ncbi:vWA domain-containing protein [Yinghuangia soli]|uniref:VWA domain-containing protein n=1 Tax=Yinghuangia soli TaxID=2908204 RepID=A0AA41Q1F4_9ACTN|nr:VWA domain-containing protein [Yinghuangia soli]MCF2528684.1 VWA domain-containing protein [Yinghuangia soli]
MSHRPRRARAFPSATAAALVSGSLLALLAPLTVAAPAGAAPGAASPGPPPKIELVLDLSGSMKADDAGGQTRLAAAKQAVARIIDTAPADAPIGLRVYGATYPGEDRAQGCADTQQLVPVAPLTAESRTAAKRKVEAMNAVGFTPIGVALRAAAADLGTEGKRRIVLVSDGDDTCAPPPPCEVAKELKAAGVDLAVDTVGFKTSGPARDQLKCIARETGGSYTDAADAQALAANLGTLFRRAWTTYQATGRPIQGAQDGCAAAPMIEPGQYLDGFAGGRDLYYRVKKRPDQLLQVSATAVLHRGYTRNSSITVLAGPVSDGEPSGWIRVLKAATGWTNILTAGARTKPGASAPGDVGCIMIENTITDAGDPVTPVELLIGMADAETAKSPAPEVPVRTGALAEGGFSFNSATPIGPGTYRQSIAVGEAPLWRVDLKAGQRLTVKAGVDIGADFPFEVTTGFTVRIHNAARNPATCDPDDSSLTKLFAGKPGRYEWTCGPWEITRSADPAEWDYDGYAMPGTYYIQLLVAEPKTAALGVIVPIDLTVDISGSPVPGDDPVFHFGDPGNGTGGTGGAASGQTPQNGPGDGAASPAPGTRPVAASGDSTAEKLALPAGIVLAVLAAGGLGTVLWRRRAAGAGPAR